MTNNLMLKGYEVELFTGMSNGQNIGVSDIASNELEGFVKEPDIRNIEYITSPLSDYSLLKESLLSPRRQLRKWLKKKNLTLLPGSTLSLGDSKNFLRSDSSNPYHEFIENKYGTSVVTSSVHINFGIEDLNHLFSAYRLLRCEASLILGLSASSPFLDGMPTGAHSQRWLQFPLTPEHVPFFLDHSQYVSWVEAQLLNGNMHNERHLWSSVRPNGPRRPYKVNRLELRICDLITDTNLLIALTALIELRIQSVLRDPQKFDPLLASDLKPESLEALSKMNDLEAAKSSLDSELHHWRDSKPITCRDWIRKLLDEVMPIASEEDMVELLAPINSVLEEGNQAMKWLHSYSLGQSVQTIIQQSIINMESEENPSEEILG